MSYCFSPTHRAWAAMQRELEHSESWRTITVEETEEFKKSSIFATWAEPVPQLLKTSDRIIKVRIYNETVISDLVVDVTHIGGTVRQAVTRDMAQV